MPKNKSFFTRDAWAMIGLIGVILMLGFNSSTLPYHLTGFRLGLVLVLLAAYKLWIIKVR